MSSKVLSTAQVDVQRVRTALESMWPGVDVGYAWDKKRSAFVIGVLFDAVPAGETKESVARKVHAMCDGMHTQHTVEVAVFE